MKHLIPIIGMLAIALPATADHINVKPGLWETTIVQTHESGIIMPASVNNLPAALQDKYRKALTDIQTTQKPRTYKYCLTAKDIEDMQTVISKGSDSQCKSVHVHHNGNVWSGTAECSNDAGSAIINFLYRVADSGHVTGTINEKIDMEGQTRTAENKLESHWLGSDCGSVQ